MRKRISLDSQIRLNSSGFFILVVDDSSPFDMYPSVELLVWSLVKTRQRLVITVVVFVVVADVAVVAVVVVVVLLLAM